MIPNPFTKLGGNTHSYSLGDNDFRLLLDQIQKPALLINLAKKVIVAANLQFTEFTGVGADEIVNSGLERAIVNCDYEKISDGSIHQWSLSRKNRNPVMVSGTTQFISQTEKLAIMTFQVETKIADDQESLGLVFFEKFADILERISEISFDDLLGQIIQISKDLFSAEYVVFYLQSKKPDEVKKIFTSGESIFPENIPAIEIKRLSQIDFWEPGKRVLSEIQRVGRMNNLWAIVTMPTAVNDEQRGLLILAFKNQIAREKYEKIIKIFNVWIQALMRFQQSREILDGKYQKSAVEIDQYSQFYENASDCAVILNDENTIVDFNNNTSKFLKYSPIELLNQEAEVIFENSEIANALARNADHSVIQSREPIPVYDRNGNKIPVLYKIIPIEIMDLHKKLLIINDASATVDAEKQIKQFENKAALGEVVADFAHEVRNPIHSLDSGLQLMRKKIGADDPNSQAVEQMHEDCLRMNDLMESVLSYSRQKIENFKVVDVEALLRRIVNRMGVKFKSSGVEILIKALKEGNTVYGDQRSLEQAFINLITNAFDAIKGSDGMISIQLDQKKGNEINLLEVSISDTGPGIPPEIREKLFEPFVSDKPKGTGLGLAITKRMIEAHQGRIELETYPGGTIFKVLLPLHEIQGEQA